MSTDLLRTAIRQAGHTGAVTRVMLKRAGERALSEIPGVTDDDKETLKEQLRDEIGADLLAAFEPPNT